MPKNMQTGVISIESNKADTIRRTRHIAGIDSIRFVAACIVVFSHCGSFPLTQGLDEGHFTGRIVQGIYGNLFPGVPAVMVFFVISGFCIHYPFRGAQEFQLLPYLVRRYVRIGLPLVAAIPLSRAVGVNLTLFQNSVLWSLLAELIYYSVYPALRHLAARTGWSWLAAASFLPAYAVVAFFPEAKDYSPYGPPLAAVVAFPCWLLGCVLAEGEGRPKTDTPSFAVRRLWTWRLIVWGLGWGCSALRFHSPLGYPWTLDLFAIAVLFWLREEIAVPQSWQRSRLLEWAGKWSYSVYLLHLVAEAAFGRMAVPDFGFNLNWLLKMLFIFGTSFVFYLLFEKPGHFAARKLGGMLDKQFQPAGKTLKSH